MRLPRADERGLDLLGGRWTKCSRAWPPRSATIAAAPRTRVRLLRDRCALRPNASDGTLRRDTQAAATDELELRERE